MAASKDHLTHIVFGVTGVILAVVVSGLDGRTFGERPFCRWKLTGYAAVASLAVIAFGLLWGIGAAP